MVNHHTANVAKPKGCPDSNSGSSAILEDGLVRLRGVSGKHCDPSGFRFKYGVFRHGR